MSRYLDPKADVVFKKIFGEHPKLLISFLNALLPLSPNSPIVTLTYLQNEQDTEAQIGLVHSALAHMRCKCAVLLRIMMQK